VKRFDNWRARRYQAQIDAATSKLALLRERQGRLEPESDEWDFLRKAQVKLFWKRNDLYAKLATTKES
jgi:hypothetical protein